MLLIRQADDRLLQVGLRKYRLPDGRVCLLWARGYFFDPTGRMWLDEEIADWLAARLGADPLAALVPGMNGCFSVAVVWPDSRVVEVGIDRFGTIPVYYHIAGRRLIVSDDFWQVADRVAEAKYERDAVLSMVLLGFLTGQQTLITSVGELAHAAIHRLSFDDNVPRLISQRYWMPEHHPGPQARPEAWRRELAGLLKSVFARHARAIRERSWNAWVPLSGGKDSRLLAGMLVRNRVSARAFSYGPTGNEETRCASQVADALGMPLSVVHVDDPSFLSPSFVSMMTRRVGMHTRFTAGLGAQLSLHMWSDTDVYMPGHVGDTLTGGDLGRGEFLIHNEAQAVRRLLDAYSLLIPEELGAALFPGFWGPAAKRRVVLAGWRFCERDVLGSLHRWHCENANRRKYLAELRTYELFGHWMLPYYDYELTDFFAGVPPGLLYRQRLYVDALIHELFTDDLAPLAAIAIAGIGRLQMPSLSWRDRLVMANPSASIGGWILDRAARTKRLERLGSAGVSPSRPSGPDPLDYWWHHCPMFRESVLTTFQDWDGMQGVVDVSALLGLLEKPLPGLFIQFAVPSLLTLYYFQRLRAAARQAPEPR